MEIRQAMGSKGKLVGAKYLRGFIEEMKASGFVANELKKFGQHDATVAPPRLTRLRIWRGKLPTDLSQGFARHDRAPGEKQLRQAE